MKKVLQFVFLILLTQACGVIKNTDKIIFRHINLNRPHGTINLEVQKSEIEKLIENRNGRFFLKDHTFGFAKTIELKFDIKNSLKKAIFSYPSNWDKNLEIQEYQSLLGKPYFKNGKTIWNDGKTQFEIYTKDNQSYSQLIDL